MTNQPCGANHTSRSREFGRLQDVLRAVGSSTLALLYSAYFTSRGIQRTGRARSSLLDDQAFGCLFQKQVTCSTTSGDFTKAAHTFPILPESCGDRITELSITERSLSRKCGKSYSPFSRRKAQPASQPQPHLHEPEALGCVRTPSSSPFTSSRRRPSQRARREQRAQQRTWRH